MGKVDRDRSVGLRCHGCEEREGSFLLQLETIIKWPVSLFTPFYASAVVIMSGSSVAACSLVRFVPAFADGYCVSVVKRRCAVCVSRTNYSLALSFRSASTARSLE